MLLTRMQFKKCLAEGVGTFVIVFVGCGAIALGSRYPTAVPSVAIPPIFGIAVTIMVYALRHISGAHFNPAVTLAFAVSRHFPIKEVFGYWISQILGAIAAVSVLYGTLPTGTSFGSTQIVSGFSLGAGLFWEMLLTFVLMFVIIAVATDSRAVGTMAGAAIGGAVMLGAFVGGPITGASMNPARSLAPALFEGRFDNLWVYFVGPTSGAIAAALLYEWIRCDVTNREGKQDESLEKRKSAAKGCC